MLMRSKLFVPGSRPELFLKAEASAADALSFDLEDAVALERKDEARAAVATYLSKAELPGKVVMVRVNAVGTAFFAADIAIVAAARVDVVNLPMVEDISAVHEAVRLIDRLEPAAGRGHIRLLVNIETPKALRKAHELATAHPRVMGLQVGYADLFEPFGIDRLDPHTLAQVRLTVRLAAAEAGVAALDGVYARVNDIDGFRAECEAARAQGFAGKSCIHPTQIATANAAFMPRPHEVEMARKILSAAIEAQAKDLGAFLVEGRMIDKPFLESARATVALADLHATKSGGA